LNDRISYWLEIAEYDLETARDMLAAGRYLYVGFMCHQVIEKTLKAAVANTGEFPPKSHRLRMLAELAGVYDRMDETQRNFLNLLEPLNIEARYPGEKSRISSELNADRSLSIMKQTQEVYEWIKATL